MPDDNKELNIQLSPQVQAQMNADPELATAVKDFVALLHQAKYGVQTGQYKTMDEAMEILTGHRPQKVDLETGEEIDGASIHDDLGLERDEDED